MNDLRKALALAANDLRLTFSDTNNLLLMLLIPLALASIIAVALGGAASGSNLQNIPLVIVNQDAGADGQNFGDVLVSVFTGQNAPQAPTSAVDCEAILPVSAADDAPTTTVPLNVLFATTLMDDPASARAQVDAGDAAAAIIIPTGFTTSVLPSVAREPQPVRVEVYADRGRTVTPRVAQQVVEGVVAQFAQGVATIQGTTAASVARAQRDAGTAARLGLLAASGGFGAEFRCAFLPQATLVRVQRETATGATVTFNPLVLFGSANAIFFMLFAAQGAAGSIIEDRNNGILPRLLATSTRRAAVLGGKIVGMIVMCVLQLVLLFVAFTVVGSLLAGRLTFIWGMNAPLLGAAVLASALAASGLATLIVAGARTLEQANLLGGVINLFMAAVGGAFFNLSSIGFLEPITRLSLVYWGTDAFSKLAVGQTDIGLNLLVLTGLGAIMLAIGTVLFVRRLEEV